VSRWNTEISDPSVIIDDNIANKARELTAGAKTELEKIRAIGTFVQNLQYISIDIGVGRGNGYRPRPSTLVLQRGYGDCKDKANLMRALLKVLKIEAYPVAIYSGDPTFVREEWASPRQFNHCIIAVKVSAETNAQTIITHPTLGRLMIFDATDPYTPVGDLPDYLQGSFALLVAGAEGRLMKMPVTAPDTNKMVRTVEMTIAENGDLTGVIRERAQGQSAAYNRKLLRAISASDYNKLIENWVVRGISTARVGKITPVDKNAENQFDLDVEVKAPVYGQLMQNRLLVFKPVVIDRLNSLWLTENKRTHPVIMEANAFTETAVFNLPNGFVVDEMPDPVNLETPFGKYSTSYEVKDNSLIFKRSLVLNAATIPVERYASVKDFFVKIRTAEQSPIVLIRK
ncbi:MAG TPA: transglutaminase-like domain-containing protein, partial [Pyrinomonadaceae bacterium]|nr:transglutaminase-like domain-containing protein [Pyrinomonadaceae bacterium]